MSPFVHGFSPSIELIRRESRSALSLRKEATMTRIARAAMLAALMSVVLAAGASAQVLSGLAGTVRDSSGAVMPGVTVEATSPALIEKVRSAVTNAEGQYRIIDLPPGTYAVTFTLTGFTDVKVENIAL